jgi:hypothetical protein
MWFIVARSGDVVMDQSRGKRRIGGDRSSPVARKITSEREAQILELRLRKVPFEKIAQMLAITKSAAWKAYYRALHRVSGRYASDIVAEESEVLDRLDSRLWRELERSGVEVKDLVRLVGQIVDIQRRRAKLLGLDAPQQLDVSLLKPPAVENESAYTSEMIERLSSDDRRQLLALIRKAKRSQ